MLATVMIVIAVAWIVQLVRVLVLLFRARHSLNELPMEVRRNCVRWRPRAWPGDLSERDRSTAVEFQKRFAWNFYVLLGTPMIAMVLVMFVALLMNTFA